MESVLHMFHINNTLSLQTFKTRWILGSHSGGYEQYYAPSGMGTRARYR
jgi:hypothetical protein